MTAINIDIDIDIDHWRFTLLDGSLPNAPLSLSFVSRAVRCISALCLCLAACFMPSEMPHVALCNGPLVIR